MILIRDIITGDNYGVFDDSFEVNEEYHYFENSTLKQKYYWRIILEEISRGERKYYIFNEGDKFIIAIYLSLNECIEKNLISC